MTTYLLTAEAEADLRGIIRYTRKQWGTVQVRRYIAKLEHDIASLAGEHEKTWGSYRMRRLQGLE